MSRTTETRRWRLRAWNKDKTLIHDQACVGDAALDQALARVEHDPATHRHTVSPE